ITNLFLLHGGGSFGHYYASKYGLSRKPSRAKAEGVSKTSAAMIDLHSIVLHEFVMAGLPCQTVLTSEFLTANGSRVNKTGAIRLETLFLNDLLPISFGNVSVTKMKSQIISGDLIALAVARKFRVNRVIFAMDVDGIFPNSKMNSPMINVLDRSVVFADKERKYDVTGGIRSKIETGFMLAALGADVFYVNGSKPDRLRELINGRGDQVKATKIYRTPQALSVKRESTEP
ncbi:MAG: isopentenyl phosphate kinase, partial [Nitrososphaerales archaeon]